MSLAIIMLGLSYAAVPLYQIFCQTIGIGAQKITTVGESENKGRSIIVNFNADISDSLPWRFEPTIKKIKVYPGDPTLTFYIAHNNTDKAITGISTYQVNPPKVGIYFNKIQCFCFEEQRLKPQESIEMPILFFIDPEIYKDPKMFDVDNITLSYTFFPVC